MGAVRSRGGAAARRRQAEHIDMSQIRPTPLQRRIGTYDLVDEATLAEFERQVDQLLETVGIEIRGDDVAIELFRQAGAKVDGARLRFEPGLVRQLCATAPSQFTQVARNRDRSVTIGGDQVVFSPAYGSPFVRDRAGGRRYGTMEDFKNFVKLAWQSRYLHHSGGTICEPVDIPVNKRHLDMVHAHITHSDKPFMGSVTTAERAADSIEMCRILFGKQFVDENCVILANINVNSPLVYDGEVTRVIRTYAAANQAVIALPFILGGAMGPVTMPGAIVQGLAEALVGVALTQLVRPGAPAIMGIFLSSMSLRSGAPTFGMPEPSLSYFVIGQMARRWKLPLRLGGSLTASKINDAQAAQESADSLFATILSGANFVLHAAGWMEGALVMDYEKFLIDEDHVGMMARMAAGLDLDSNGFAQDALEAVIPGGHFLDSAHTFANYKTAFFEPELSDAKSFEQWRDDGEVDIYERASRLLQKRLAREEMPPLDPAINREIKAFVEQRKAGMPDAWY